MTTKARIERFYGYLFALLYPNVETVVKLPIMNSKTADQ